MKRMFKWFWYGVVGIVLVIVAFTIADTGGEPGEKVETTTETAQTAAESDEKDSPKDNAPEITKKEFEAMESGMTYEEVVEIIGSEGEVLSESGSEGEAAHTVMYQWDGKGQMGANANATFQGGELINKAQFGLGE